MNKIKKIFGGIELTYKKIILSAIILGIYTALVAIIPILKHTSLNTISVSFEVWILIGIFIIMNSKSNKDSALKCFLFFLISQPLVYLIEVPFVEQGWKIFGYYKPWFIWTILCLPMGYIGYYLKKDKWYSYIILLPMIFLLSISYHTYLTYFTFYKPKYILISLFCIITMLLYPNILFNNKKLKITGTIISSLIITGITIYVSLNPYIYSTEILGTIDNNNITEYYEASLKDDKYGKVSVEYIESLDGYMVHADFKKYGKTELIIKTPEDTVIKYNLTIEIDTYKLEEKERINNSEEFTIIDKTIGKDIICAQALEKFYEDDTYTYSFPCIKSEYIVVKYSNGKESLVSEELKKGTIKISDLDKYNIKYYKDKKIS